MLCGTGRLCRYGTTLPRCALKRCPIRKLSLPRQAESLETLYTGTLLRYPESFEALCLSHSWEDAEVGEVELADNPAADDLVGLASAVRYDPILWEFLVSQGYLIVGRMSGGRYDPCAVNLRGANENRGAIVRVYHEDILSFERLGRPMVIAPSIDALLKEGVSPQ